jgi:hypothetical protein|tara:strand:- start:22921 stop:23829 length:909 start_codon:yes stop_codon:yes gene_type:complete
MHLSDKTVPIKTVPIMHLSDKAVLVHLGVSQWIAKKLDRAASDVVATQFGATAKAGNYNKSLLPTCNELEAVKTKTSIIRKKFYSNTLPWGIEGTFILPSANYLAFMNEYRAEKGQWVGLVNEFYDAYPQACMDAQRMLGGLHKPSEYPILTDLKKKFHMDMAIMPVPMAGDFRIELAEGEIAKITSDVEQRVIEGSKAAMDDVWQRLYDRIAWLAEKLSDPNKTFHDATYEDAQETCKLLVRLNFTNDPDLEAMRKEVQNKLFNTHPEVLRNDPDVRRDTATEAQVIMDKMGAFMGGTDNE